MDKLSIRLNNEFELEIDSVVENNNVLSKMRSLYIRIPLIQADHEDIAEIEKNLTPDNTTSITVLADGEPMSEFLDYTVIHTIDKTINKNEQFVSIFVTKKIIEKQE